LGADGNGLTLPTCLSLGAVQTLANNIDVPVAVGALAAWGSFAGVEVVELLNALGELHQRGDLRQR